jgi:antitoxin CptB
MDLMLGPFADRHLASMNETDLAAYERLLNESDPDLMNWLSGQIEPPPEMDSDLRALLRRAAEVIRQGSAAAAGQRKTS